MSVDVNFGIKVLGLFIDNERRIFQDILCQVVVKVRGHDRSWTEILSFYIIIPNFGVGQPFNGFLLL